MKRAVIPTILALATICGAAQMHAQVSFQNATGLTAPTNTVTFSEVTPPVNTAITTQFQDYGITFPAGIYYAPAYNQDFGTPNIDPTRSVGNFIQFQPSNAIFRIRFTSPVTGVALAIQSAPGVIDASLLLEGTPIPDGTHTFHGGYGPEFTENFFCIEGGVFDEIIFSSNAGNPALVFDNVQFNPQASPNTPPSLVCPEPTTINCAPPSGLAVTLQASVSDPDAQQALIVRLSEGETVLDTQSVGPTPLANSLVTFAELTFPPGEHTLTIEVSDGTDVATCGTTLTILADTLPPQFTSCPGDQTVQATGPAGAVATWSPAEATDNCGEVTISYSHASGSVFPIGRTTVVCTARDAVGLESVCSFTITVQAPNNACDLILALIVKVNALPNLHHGIRNALVVKLQAAAAACAAGDLVTACASVQDFINQTRAQAGKKIPRPVAQQWIADATAIRQALGCP